MSKKMLIEATHPEETRVVVLEDSRLDELDVETSTKKQIKGNIYLAKVVRVEPSLQAAFVEYGGNRHGFLAFNEIHPDYYQIPAADLEKLKKEMHEELDDLPHKDIVTFHEAFPYLAKEFKLNIVSVIEREPGTEPTPQELEDTIAKVNTLPVKVLFTEPQYSPAAAETIAKETGAKIYQLDPVVTGEANLEAMDAYISTMKKNMNVLKEALQ